MQNPTIELLEILEDPVVDVQHLRLYVYKNGVPNNNKLRSKVWKLLLRYYSPDQRTWVNTDQSFIKLYRKQRSLFYDTVKVRSNSQDVSPGTTPKSEELMMSRIIRTAQQSQTKLRESEEGQIELDAEKRDSPKLENRTINTNPTKDEEEFIFRDKKLAKIIDKDLARTNDGEKKAKYNPVLKRILNIMSNMPGGIPYVQGLNVIANVFYHVFIDASDSCSEELAEVSTFFCMSMLLSNIRDWFDPSYDLKPTGIRASMGRVMWCVKQKNSRLADTVNKMIDPTFYLFRWLSLLGALELPMEVTMQMWDRMFVEVRGMRYLIAFLAAMILEVECSVGRFEDTLKLLQNYPIKDFERLHTTTCLLLRDVFRINPAKVDWNEKPVGCVQGMDIPEHKKESSTLDTPLLKFFKGFK
ncbi:hypothetical protein EIN_082980 [Entamoeba invadens IP1]|uniref:hypothetical protein n=1 Tax=Entamoeba invadens IP1 TaxID=370355 RepID=UPI0002C3E9C9|nr:hypothetical protein EIN_082980 [Entamoeba invadens IP1]ELP85186.1 hypothetical protein EIN_082980 [Entamoeba invadens IP1]|eukprot:XP_004184532.1 hypothetical protein EIN_082980 [Entamoeba invadens IP1]